MSNEYLNDPDYLFAILACLVKREGGELRISEEEMEQVTKNDLMGMYWKPNKGEMVLKMMKPEDIMRKPLVSDMGGMLEN